MICLADTNILLRAFDRGSPLYASVRSSASKLKRQGWLLRPACQNFIEFWNVATRPLAANGLGLTVARAERLLRRLERVFPPLPDTDAIYPEWRRLVIAFGVSGVKVHDARLVAVMNVYGVKHILTLNPGDFARYASEGIIALDPATLVSSP